MSGMDRLTDLGWAMEAVKAEDHWSAEDWSCPYEPSDGHHAVATILNAVISGDLVRRALQAAPAPSDGLREALEAIRDGCGPNHLSKYARDTARSALAKIAQEGC